jgi:hypothetical protein
MRLHNMRTRRNPQVLWIVVTRCGLSAAYAGNGISFARNRLGLSDNVLNALPYPSWSGNISTNVIVLTDVAAAEPKK